MNNYNFESLNDKEFESLVNDLIEKKECTTVERFKEGKDQGIDGRFFCKKNDKKTIIQSKHWKKSGFSQLLSHCKNKEAVKVKKLSPDRYILATSVPLSPANKKELSEVFSPYLLEEDILGLDDISSLLSNNTEIEKKHYKLWMTSSSVLQVILNSNIVNRSKFTLERIAEDTKLYVKTDNHDKATNILAKSHCLIVTGEPGAGKTTLAEMICQELVAKGYEFVEVNREIDEAYQLYCEGRKQVFFYDDFLGRNYLESIVNKEDSDIMNFIKKVGRVEDKRFILTSRSTILNQGKLRSELLKKPVLTSNEYLLNVTALKKLEKARILYNHLYHKSLSPEFIEQIYKNKFYFEVIEHRNFNPRLIEFFTESSSIINTSASNYCEFIRDSLRKPKEVWRHVFDNQLNEHERIITYLVALNGRKIEESKLNLAVNRFFTRQQKDLEHNSFSLAVEMLTGSVLTRYISVEGKVSFDVFNPSVADYVISVLRNNNALLTDLSLSLESIEHFDFGVRSFSHGSNLRGGRMPFGKSAQATVCENILSFLNKEEPSYPSTLFIKTLCNLVNNNERYKLSQVSKNKVLTMLNELKEIKGLTYYKAIIINHVIQNKQILKNQIEWEEVVNLMCLESDSHDTLIVISIMCNALIGEELIEEEDAVEKFAEAAYECLSSDIHADLEYDIDESLTTIEEVEAEVYNAISDLIYDYALDLSLSSLEDDLFEEVNCEEIVENNLQRMDEDDTYRDKKRLQNVSKQPRKSKEQSDVDDLFDRN